MGERERREGSQGQGERQRAEDEKIRNEKKERKGEMGEYMERLKKNSFYFITALIKN